MSAKAVCTAVRAFAVVLALGAMAEAQLPKQGAVTGTVTFTVPPETKEVGPNRIFISGTNLGLSLNDNGEGLLHQHQWYCTHAMEILDGVVRGNGDCQLSDMDGDKIFLSWRTLPYQSGPPIPTEGLYHGGTGKFAGLTGGYNFLCTPLSQHFICKYKNAKYQLP